MTDPKELMSCPFCGSNDVTIIQHPPHKHKLAEWMPDYTGGWEVSCDCCPCGFLAETKEAAISLWQTRAITAREKRLVEALREIDANPHYGATTKPEHVGSLRLRYENILRIARETLAEIENSLDKK